MAGYYSILRFVNNPLSDESIALGLVVIASGEQQQSRAMSGVAQAQFRLSETKVEFAKKLNPASAKLLGFSLAQLHTFFKQDLVDQSNQVVRFPVQVQQEFIERLSNYNNGLLQFSQPAYIESDQLLTAFGRYFNQFIESNVPIKEKAESPSETRLQQRVRTDLYEPLRGVIDVDYTLRKRQLPSLYFDYHLDGVGVNGAMYAVKAVDLNATHHIDTIQRELSEFESVIDRLNRFAKQHNIVGKPGYYLVVDPYEGDNRDRKELYDILNSTQQFELVRSSKLPEITKQFRNNHARKFSEVLAE
jgi:hypothetical protein